MNLRDPSAPALDRLIDKVQSRLNARATAATREWWTKYLRDATSFGGAKTRDVRTAVHASFEEERLGEHFSILRSGQVHGPALYCGDPAAPEILRHSFAELVEEYIPRR